jgi:acetyl-CoA synthetase
MNWDLINNAAYLAIDKVALKTKDKIALFWIGENQKEKQYTFGDIFKLANRFANYLKTLKIKKGDRVFFFLPRIPLIYYGFLGTIKTGAIAGTLFSAFGIQALYDRLSNSDARILITNQDLYPRLKTILPKLKHLDRVIIADNNLYGKLNHCSSTFKNTKMKPSDPAFMLYTSATGNTPVSGITLPHQSIIQQVSSAKYFFDFKKSDRYWCTADPGWVTGVVYGILTPWGCGATQLVYEGRFDTDIWLNFLRKYRIKILYTAPTALRMIQKVNLKKIYHFPDLRLIASVGEALPPNLFFWTKKFFNLPVRDTYWQTETGSMMIGNYSDSRIKPGSMGKPLPGIKAGITDEKGRPVTINQVGNLVFKPPWPSMMVKVWKNTRLFRSYYKNGWFTTGDQAYKDKDGYYWFVGRKSEIIKTAGERVGTFEVESAINRHQSVLENAVIGKPDPLRGEIIKAFIILKDGQIPSDYLKQEIQSFVKTQLAGHAYPREIEFIDRLPKNHSGKIMRRLLKAKELGQTLGDVSTLEEN